MTLVDIQVDRMVGPTHHFGGLGIGNLASHEHAGQVSNPAAAALQGLDKMGLVARFDVHQLILPPQPRPQFRFLRSLGFFGSNADVLRRAFDESPRSLSAAMSCSAMWTANAATVSPAVDCRDGLLTMTVANLTGSLHRAIEPAETMFDLQSCFGEIARIHPPLPGGTALRDEGAANHIRLGTGDNQPGVHLYVHGDGEPQPNAFWPRQSRAACEAIVRQHGIDEANVFFIKQNPIAIDAGAFHNDVVAASHQNLLLYHELAFEQTQSQFESIAERFRALTNQDLIAVEVSQAALPIEAAVQTYLFNSQLVTPADSNVPVLICPIEVHQHRDARRIAESWRDDAGLFADVQYIDLRQSMAGGGGPACLRLRVPVDQDAVDQLPTSARWSEDLEGQLREQIEQHYPTTVTLRDLADLEFIRQTDHALMQVTRLLK